MDSPAQRPEESTSERMALARRSHVPHSAPPNNRPPSVQPHLIKNKTSQQVNGDTVEPQSPKTALADACLPSTGPCVMNIVMGSPLNVLMQPPNPCQAFDPRKKAWQPQLLNCTYALIMGASSSTYRSHSHHTKQPVAFREGDSRGLLRTRPPGSSHTVNAAEPVFTSLA